MTQRSRSRRPNPRARRGPTCRLRRSSRRIPFLLVVAGALATAGCVPDGPDRTTGIATTLPPPSDLEVRDVGTSRVELSWHHDGDPGDGTSASEFRIYRDGERVASTDATSHSDRGLQPDTEYEYRVSALDDAGVESDPTPPVLATTQPRKQDDGEEDGEEDGEPGEGEDDDDEADEDDSPPSAPSKLEAEDEEATRIELTWKAAEDPESGIDAYVIYRKLHKEGGIHDHYAGGEEVARTGSTEYTDTELEPDTEYVYRVSAVNGAGLEGEKSDPEKAKTEKEKDD